jgi:hypothetical protein
MSKLAVRSLYNLLISAYILPEAVDTVLYERWAPCFISVCCPLGMCVPNIVIRWLARESIMSQGCS